MFRNRTLGIGIGLALGLGLPLVLLWALGSKPSMVFAQGSDGYSTYHVAPSCTSVPIPCYTRIQAAVDAADDPDDVVKVAAGIYTDTHVRDSLVQVLYVSKTMTIQGGYTTAFTEPPDPRANPTTLDAQGEERVLYITGDISLTVEGLRITGGRAPWNAGWWGSVGGGVTVVSATATFSNNQVLGSRAMYGGGVYVSGGNVVLVSNVISANAAVGDGNGGGLYLYRSDATLVGNTVTANTASACGGGLYLDESSASLKGNVVSGNTAYGYSGGMEVWESNATLSGNTISSNTASSGRGGGLSLYLSDAVTLTNNMVTDNRAGTAGNGLNVAGSSARLLHTTIARNNGGDGSGVYVTHFAPWGGPTYYSTVLLTNTILVGHTAGIEVTDGNTAMLEATLWGSGAWANDADWEGGGTVITGTPAYNYWGDPDFVDPGGGDYHIAPDSAAIDRGTDAGVTTDIDGDCRPLGPLPDLGADEAWQVVFLPLVIREF
jgi:parallel beta-helix repeat protein